MTKLLIQKYKALEAKIRPLKERYEFLKDNKGDKTEIKELGHELTKLNINQVHILIDLELKE